MSPDMSPGHVSWPRFDHDRRVLASGASRVGDHGLDDRFDGARKGIAHASATGDHPHRAAARAGIDRISGRVDYPAGQLWNEGGLVMSATNGDCFGAR
jgi:hypothetical protein